MSKELKEMTKEELWQLFPIILKEGNEAYPLWYEEEKNKILMALGAEKIERIHHMGSTSVKGLLAKPTVDILLEIKEEVYLEEMKKSLKEIGFDYSSQPDNPPPHMMFLKGYTKEGFENKVYHLHVRYLGDWNELYFRDYLREEEAVRHGYSVLKTELAKQFVHNRDGYTEAKGDFIREMTEKAREKYGNRYGKTDKNTTVSELKENIWEFCRKRNWNQDVNAKDLAMALSVETAELVEIFQWMHSDEVENLMKEEKKRTHLKEEIVDVFWYLMRICGEFDIDLTLAFQEKEAKNAVKYPCKE